MDRGRLHRVEQDARGAQVGREVELGPEAGEVGAGIAGVQEVLVAQVRGVGGQGQAMAGELGQEPVAIIAAGVAGGIGVAGEVAELDAVEPELAQPFQDLGERHRPLALGPGPVGPGPDRRAPHACRLPAGGGRDSGGKLAAERETDRAAGRALGFGRVAGQFVRVFFIVGGAALSQMEETAAVGFGRAAGRSVRAAMRRWAAAGFGRAVPGIRSCISRVRRRSGSNVRRGHSFVQFSCKGGGLGSSVPISK